ncbi:glycoside hydrolase family 13 protein [Lutimonas saemankumensis]|uniref:glycoside hydrolase family 13 protein n=1 Tax=Lutimonas saemankumensis TaxID=483016 RepID=UPI001CD49F62|nr:glycoside hydrolase family 13 protein [Lutimonas saemankumensis]MCA0932763.1 glycoside hydrolase family 13 protein [Lutimonas saemankumensis]
MKRLALFFISFICISAFGQIERVEPPNWWVGFKNQDLQLLIKGENISDYTPNIEYAGVSIVKTNKAKSPNYLFLDLSISTDTKPGTMQIVFERKGKKKLKYEYELKKRSRPSEEFLGFDSSDVVYLITPDRFANALTENDIVKGLKEAAIDRNDDYARHGGDIKGISNHLDYIDEMGFTAIWSCPVLTNDMPQASYHGYAITDLYQIDPRFGTLEEYIELSQKAKAKGIKLIMDQVANHCGIGHWWIKDLPFEDWLNYQAAYEAGEKTTYSNHKRTTNQDIYASKIDAIGMTNGWFTDSMPDLNQNNPFMATYLIQNSIWWIETAQLGGIRQDTYPYPDKIFMSEWAGAIMKEYPNFSIVGEEWSYNPLLVAYWQQGAENHDGYHSNLTSSMDFPMQKTISDALKEKEQWNSGLIKIYEGLANDFHYPNPEKIMIFPDNHDMDRIHTQLNEDPVLTKMALAYHLTLPRIPQIYYGTEILMQNTAKPGDHGLIRTDFPGGWEGDEVNAFTGEGLKADQKDMQAYVKTLLRFRKNSKAIHKGKTVHFAPKDGVYVMFRVLNEETVVLILNKNDDPVELDLLRFKEMILDNRDLKDVITGENLIWKDKLVLKEKGARVLSTK